MSIDETGKAQLKGKKFLTVALPTFLATGRDGYPNLFASGASQKTEDTGFIIDQIIRDFAQDQGTLKSGPYQSLANSVFIESFTP